MLKNTLSRYLNHKNITWLCSKPCPIIPTALVVVKQVTYYFLSNISAFVLIYGRREAHGNINKDMSSSKSKNPPQTKIGTICSRGENLL